MTTEPSPAEPRPVEPGSSDPGHLRLVGKTPIEEGLAFDLGNPELRNDAWRLRQRGLDDDSLRLCLAGRALDRIIERNRGRQHHVVLACAPKSASSFLSEVLLHVTTFRRYFLAPLGDDHERHIDRRSIPLFLATDTVSQEHLKATAPDVRLLRQMGVRPVVLVRNLFDSLVSLSDQIIREPQTPWPMAHVPAAFPQWTGEEQLWFVARMFTPWFFSFIASWQDARSEIDALWITYDDVVNRTADTVRRVLHHCAIPFEEDRIEHGIGAVDRAMTRFNRGVPGRGRVELSIEQQHAVEAIAAHYAASYDLTCIGLGATGTACRPELETKA